MTDDANITEYDDTQLSSARRAQVDAEEPSSLGSASVNNRHLICWIDSQPLLMDMKMSETNIAMHQT